MTHLATLFLSPSPSLCASFHPSSGVTYTLSGGRLGDNLLACAHAKWISYSLGLPLVYQPFPYSEHLQLSVDPSVRKMKRFSKLKQFPLKTVNDHLLFLRHCWEGQTEPLLIMVPFYPESYYDYDIDPAHAMWTQVDWEDANFIRELRTLISPIASMPLLQLPKGRVSVAIHMRTGVNYDGPTFNSSYPLKGPNEAYYVEALTYLVTALQKPLYVYIFTDDPNPPVLCQRMAQQFGGWDIAFDCRKDVNRQDLNVLEDFFALGQFDCLIRTDSNYGIVASKLFPYKVIISPHHFRRESDNSTVIDRFLLHIAPREGLSQPIKTILRK
jgi:hypothetical protein